MSHFDACAHGAPLGGCFAFGCAHERQAPTHDALWTRTIDQMRAQGVDVDGTLERAAKNVETQRFARGRDAPPTDEQIRSMAEDGDALTRPASPTHDPALEARVAAKLDADRAAAELVALVRENVERWDGARGFIVFDCDEADRLRELLARIGS